MRRVLIVALGLVACDPDLQNQGPTYHSNIQNLLIARCAPCHTDLTQGGYSVLSYLEATACLPGGSQPVIEPAAQARILSVLDAPGHQGLLSEQDQTLLKQWVQSGAPARTKGVHASGFADPRAAQWHGHELRSSRWAPMFDAQAPDACGRCHEHSPAGPETVRHFAPNATACTDCHLEGPEACDTCHAVSPNPSTLYRGCIESTEIHEAHASPKFSNPMACGTCHPHEGTDLRTGVHGDGQVQVQFNTEIAGANAKFDSASRTCETQCHGPSLAWRPTRDLDCDSCHQVSTETHFAGACNDCHQDVNASGTAIVDASRHVDGILSLGDGEGCGGCHGQGQAWPSTGAHPAHQNPLLSEPVPCGSCHIVPDNVLDAGHIDRQPLAEVLFDLGATARGLNPSYDGTACFGVACHGADFQDSKIPQWRDDSGAASQCGACHGLPPAPPHAPYPSCESTYCHGGVVAPTPDGPVISPRGRSRHIDGIVHIEGGNP